MGKMLTDDLLNNADIYFVGLLPIKENISKEELKQHGFNISSYSLEQREYFSQKYYENWLNSIFLQNNNNQEVSNHYELDAPSDTIRELTVDNTTVQYYIEKTELLIFPNNLGIILIKTKIIDPKWNEIGFYCHHMRKTLIRQSNQNDISLESSVDNLSAQKSPLFEHIEKKVIPAFCSDNSQWTSMNAHLKCSIYVDINKSLPAPQMKSLLFSLGTFYNPNFDETAAEAEFIDKTYEENSISIYKNWKVLILEDTMTRISINNKYKKLEDEYFFIYLYTIYSHYFLQRSNEESGLSSSSINNVNKLRRRYLQIINDYQHNKISYKFLPNLYYRKLKKIFDIDAEIEILEKKLTRLNGLRQEEYENKVGKILNLLTIITLISVAYDGGQMIACKDPVAFNWSFIILILLLIVLGGLILSRNIINRD
jgi:hypothetical protein